MPAMPPASSGFVKPGANARSGPPGPSALAARALRPGRRLAPALLTCMLVIACDRGPAPASGDAGAESANPVGYFEIPVVDIDRATRFYTAVFGWPLQRQTVDGYQMALFPRRGGPGASGALARGDIYVPAKTGPVIYFTVDDLEAVLARARQQRARILYPAKAIGDGARVAEIEDSEGNRIALLDPAG